MITLSNGKTANCLKQVGSLYLLVFQSTIDLVGYAAGATDEFRGTGVWSGVQFKRETPADEVLIDPNQSAKVDSDTMNRKSDEKETTTTTPPK